MKFEILMLSIPRERFICSKCENLYSVLKQSGVSGFVRDYFFIILTRYMAASCRSCQIAREIYKHFLKACVHIQTVKSLSISGAEALKIHPG